MDDTNKKMTPMMEQYHAIKATLPKEALLLYRLGDFYEMFLEDANRGARLLRVSLTKRGDMPMCGIPHHAAATYISRLLKAGCKVAICDQVEEARPGKLVKREVTRILSPGAHFDERMLLAELNNFLGSITQKGKVWGLAVADLTTGEFLAAELDSRESLETELERLGVVELVFPEGEKEAEATARNLRLPGSSHDNWAFTSETAEKTLTDHFGVTSLDGFGLGQCSVARQAAGGLLHYVVEQLRGDVSHLTKIGALERRGRLLLDTVTLKNLEILEPIHKDAPKEACLFGVLNDTATPMGARTLRDWLSRPLCEADAVNSRLDAVQAWMHAPNVLERFRESMKEISDLERVLSRLSIGSGNARDLLALRIALEKIPTTQRQIRDLNQRDDKEVSTLLKKLETQLCPLPELVDWIRRSIEDEAPTSLKDGGMIRDGFHEELDTLRQAAREGRQWVLDMQKKEIEQTGIPSLKIGFNSVFGYFIEVTKTHLAKVPDYFIRKQTIANGERYITPKLKELENKILGSEERSSKLEYEIFQEIREKTLSRLKEIQQTARALAQLDVLACLAKTARTHNYVRPEVKQEGIIKLVAGRHPVLERWEKDEPFVPNDTLFLPETHQIALITGPNMAGKSTYIRQVALISLMAHVGSFVPATKARVDILDRIFTRIGAGDHLVKGQSTFMVEMTETANILNNASQNSLVILDEVGRGTSTFDGLSLAWAIVEYLHHNVGSKTLFATHYHELTELEGRLERLRNYNVAVKEEGDQIVFLRKILPGGADKSYGIQVARLAGIPKTVISRAKEALQNLEATSLTVETSGKVRKKKQAERDSLQKLESPPQLDLFQSN